MAGTKISELPAATLPLTGAELVPVVQSGATVQTTLATMPYVPTGTGAVTTTVQAKLRQTASVKDFGAVGDGVADDTAAIQAAITYCLSNGLTLCAEGSYRVTSSINFRYITVDFSNASINVAHAGIGIFIGGNATNANNPEQKFFSVTRSVGTDSSATPTVRCIGAKGQHIYVDRATYFQIYADTEPAVNATDYSSAYSSFWLKYAETIELTNNPATTGSSVQWINENQFYLNRTSNILINGTYAHNHNNFYSGALENTASINIDRGSDNYFYGMRFETGPTTIVFGTNASRNIIQNTWDSSESIGFLSPIVTGTITDNGVSNVVYDSKSVIYRSNIVAGASIADAIVNNKSGQASARLPQLQRIIAGNNTDACVSDFVQAVQDDVYQFNYRNENSGDTVRYRAYVAFYDKNLVAVTAVTNFLTTGNLTAASGNILTNGTGASYAYGRLTAAAITAGVAYVVLGVRSSNGQLANALSRDIDVVRYSKTTINNPLEARYQSPMQMVTAIPTQGFVPLGWTCVNTNGLSFYICIFSLETTLSAGALSGATSITVANGTGTANGDVIGINLDNRDTHWTTIASGGGTTSITLTAGLAGSAASGSRVVFNRWATK
ncbi:MAG: hypothetical protein EHM17_00285 [Verrucomicrobiaceae bacterium]|nr:MAG: hypothetical protein EHM17_14345 [Verrucomicrobiaceae bacterium]RPJ33336.1 MAG: hypothetical protein EHM17_10695 [Verrucomicrobiaceae bacterium]RPJ36032.1 MAG: hypothetical protein EHM17_00285 [Verrucomicrobiaceae bacterium]